jgi:uncharacterized membrane protein
VEPGEPGGDAQVQTRSAEGMPTPEMDAGDVSLSPSVANESPRPAEHPDDLSESRDVADEDTTLIHRSVSGQAQRLVGGGQVPSDQPPHLQAPPQAYPPPRATPQPLAASSNLGAWGAPEPGGPTTLTFSPRTAAGVSYLFLWISGVLVYFNERRNTFVRFHALQSILFGALVTIVGVVGVEAGVLLIDLGSAWHASILSAIGLALAVLIPFTIVLLWWVLLVAAWTGHYLKIPILGDYAERYAAAPLQQPTPPLS